MGWLVAWMGESEPGRASANEGLVDGVRDALWMHAAGFFTVPPKGWWCPSCPGAEIRSQSDATAHQAEMVLRVVDEALASGVVGAVRLEGAVGALEGDLDLEMIAEELEERSRAAAEGERRPLARCLHRAAAMIRQGLVS